MAGILDPSAGSLSVGDPIRNKVKLTIYSTLILSVFFEGFAYISTQLPRVRAESPWANDPYDVVISFAIFFIPILATLILIRSQLCRKYEPLPIFRIIGIVKTCNAIACVIGMTVIVDWFSLIVGTNRNSWGRYTILLLILLILVLINLGDLIVRSHQLFSKLPTSVHRIDESSAWVAELSPLSQLITEKFPFGEKLVYEVATWIENHLINGRIGVRRKPGVFLVTLSLVTGLAIIGLQTLKEGGLSGVNWLFLIEEVAVAAGGFFAFAVLVNRALNLVSIRPPRNSKLRAAWMAVTLAALALPLSLAFRDEIWRSLGLGAQVNSPGQLGALVSLSFSGVFLLSFTFSYSRG